MARDKICTPFLALASPENKFTVSTIEDMQSRKYLKIGDIVELNGYYTAGDGAGHKRKIEATDDGSGVQLANGLWANIVHNSEVYGKQDKDSNILSGAFINSVKEKNTGSGMVINIIGDSISYGLDSTDMQEDGWVGILKKSFMSELESTNTGFEPFRFESESKITYMYNKTNWSVEEVNKGEYIGGIAFKNKTTDPFILKTRVYGRMFRIYFQKYSSGTADIFVNNKKVGTLRNNTSVGGDNFGYIDIPLSLKELDSFVEISVVPYASDSNIRLLGWSQFDIANNAHINNFSVGGRRFENIEETLFNDILSCDIMIFALNHNDRVSYENDELYKNNFNRKFEKLIQLANIKNVRVFVLDFMWSSEQTSPLREYLKYTCAINKTIYINTPNLFKNNRSITTQDEKYNIFKIFKDDLSHPNDRGHEFIFSTVSKELGLMVRNKDKAFINDPRWYRFSLITQGVKNGYGGISNLASGYKLTPDGVLWRFTIDNDEFFGGISPSKEINVANATCMIENHRRFFSADYKFYKISAFERNDSGFRCPLGFSMSSEYIKILSFNEEWNRKVGVFLQDYILIPYTK